ncbi:hypothetical protein BGX20_003081 [Mortierella sp. AD010]|nr:hypothetical protein BGX20_003081 [Mortierella sp. AD010]
MPGGRTRALLRLVEFSRAFGFSSESNTIGYWKSLTTKFYANTGRLKYTISNPDTGVKRIFELATHTIPHFYLTNVKSGVNEVQLIWEQDLGQTSSLPLTVECPGISLVSTYRDGAKVVSRGKIKATFTNNFQFDLLELTMHDFDEFIVRPIDEISTTPNVEPKTEGKRRPSSKQAALLKKQPQNMQERIVNEFGVAHDTMRMLEVTDHCSKMKELLQYSATHNLGAAESLAAIAQEIREHSGGARQVNQSNHRVSVSTSPLPHYSAGHVAASSDGASGRISTSPGQIKRATSIAISPKESGHNGSPAVSPTMDGLQGNSTTSRMSTPTLQATVISNAASGTGMPQSMATGLGLSLAGSPIQTSSNLINTAVSPGSKSTKRGRTAPMTPTLAAAVTGGTKGSVPSGANVLGQGGKVRKGSGRKGSLKRKASLTDETGMEPITPGTIAAGPLESTPGSVGRNSISMSGSITTTGGLTPNTGMVHLMSSSHQALPFNGQAGNGIHVHVNGAPMPVTTSGNHQDSTMYLNALSQPQGSMLPSQKAIYPGGLSLGVAPTPMYLNIGSGGHVPMAVEMIAGMGNGPGPIQGQAQGYTHWRSHVQGYGQAHNGVHPQPQAAGHPGMTGLSIVDGTTGGGQMGQC